MRLFLSLYACEPNRGSEPGVGWAWALGMAKRHETYVLTRANNKSVIEAELEKLKIPENERPKFLYVDLPVWVRKLKKAHIISVGFYYLLWQFTARRTFDRSGIKVDVIHHVTFNSYVCPGVWWHRKEEVVLGPLGGTSVCARQFLRAYSLRERSVEIFRGFVRSHLLLTPFYLQAIRNADFVMHTSAESLQRCLKKKIRCCQMLETAVCNKLTNRNENGCETKSNHFVWAGTLCGCKAGEIALRAYAKAFNGVQDAPALRIYGEGPQLIRLISLAEKLQISGNTAFCGNVTQEELWESIGSAIAFVFTSVRDTSGNVVIESLALGTPVICFNHQGVGEITDDSCAIRINPTGWDESINGFADAMKRLASDPELAERMGNAGRQRVLSEFTWEKKFAAVDAVYRELLK